jgi:hypothetical protein
MRLNALPTTTPTPTAQPKAGGQFTLPHLKTYASNTMNQYGECVNRLPLLNYQHPAIKGQFAWFQYQTKNTVKATLPQRSVAMNAQWLSKYLPAKLAAFCGEGLSPLATQTIEDVAESKQATMVGVCNQGTIRVKYHVTPERSIITTRVAHAVELPNNRNPFYLRDLYKEAVLDQVLWQALADTLLLSQSSYEGTVKRPLSHFARYAPGFTSPVLRPWLLLAQQAKAPATHTQ